MSCAWSEENHIAVPLILICFALLSPTLQIDDPTKCPQEDLPPLLPAHSGPHPNRISTQPPTRLHAFLHHHHRHHARHAITILQTSSHHTYHPDLCTARLGTAAGKNSFDA